MLRRIGIVALTAACGAGLGWVVVWFATGVAGAAWAAGILMLPVFGLLGFGLASALPDKNRDPAAPSAYAGNSGNILS